MTLEERKMRDMAMRDYKAKGHTNKEVAKKFNLHEDTVKIICKGIAPQVGRRGRKRIQITDDLRNLIRSYYTECKSYKQTAREFGVNEHIIKRECADIQLVKEERCVKALKLINEGYTAQEIVKICGYGNETSVYSLAKSHGLKVAKACEKKHEAMRSYKAEGHSHKEVAEKFGVAEATSVQICKGIAPQKAKPPKDGYKSPNKGILQDIDNVKRIINERAKGFEYAGNYTGSNGSVDLRCKKCGHVHTHSWWGIRHKGATLCPNCQKKERQEREAEEKKKREAEREKQRINAERKKRGEQAIKLLKHAKRLHRCPVCGTITDNKIYCSQKCYAKAHERTKDANRRKKIKNAIIDKDISLEKLYKRDNGICSICGGKCDWSDHQYRGRYFIVGKTYPTIDHVIPLAKGGTHSWDNVKLAHHSCNTAKGASLVG